MRRRLTYGPEGQPSLLVIPEGAMTSAVSLYRAMGPLAAMRRTHQVAIGITNTINWATMAMHDIVLIQRAHSQEHSTVFDMARLEGRPVWLDYDDDMFAIPTDNLAHKQYMSDAVHSRIAKMAARAAAITVSTAALAERFTPLNRNVHVIPNAFSTDLFGDLAAKPSALKHCLWRGSNTHERDLLLHGPEITKVINRHPDWTFTFVGYNPWFITDRCGENVKLVPALDPLDYFTFLRVSAPSVVFVPLHDSKFNRAKSNIGWQEATFAGAATVATDLPEWNQPGVMRAKDSAHFGQLLETAIEDKDGRALAWRESSAAVIDGFLLEKVNKLRASVIEDLWTKSLDPSWQQLSRTDRTHEFQAEAATG